MATSTTAFANAASTAALYKLYHQPESFAENPETLSVIVKNSSNVETILLQTSFIRKLYSYYYNNHEVFSMDVNTIVLELLLNQLRSSCNQYVLFTTSKALVSVFTVLPPQVKSKCISSSLTISLSCDHNYSQCLYCLQTVTESLKLLRKSDNNATMVDSCVPMVLSRSFDLMPSNQSEGVLTELVLEQYLSLMVECLRCDDSVTSSILMPLLPTIVSSVMKCTSVTLILCSIKLVDILRKITLVDSSIDRMDHLMLHDHSYTLFHSYITRTIMVDWYQRSSVTLYQSFIHTSNTRSSTPSPTINTGHYSVDETLPLAETLLRKYLVFCLSLTSWIRPHKEYKCLCTPLTELLSNMKTISVQSFHLSDQIVVAYVQKLVLNLAMEEDSCLVTILIYILKIKDKSLPPIIQTVCDIHSFFIHFMDSIAYDSSTLLDLIISTETNFDAFFSDYLQLISSEDGGSQLIHALQCTTDNDHLSMVTECLSCLYTQLDNAMSKGLVETSKAIVIHCIMEVIETMAV